MDTATNLADKCRSLVRDLKTNPPALAAPRHAGPPATLADHLLTAAALVACLAEGEPQRDLLRFVALIHDLPDWRAHLDSVGERALQWANLLREHGALLDQKQLPDLSGLDPLELLLAQAHLAASARLPIHEGGLGGARSRGLGQVELQERGWSGWELSEPRAASVMTFLRDGVQPVAEETRATWRHALLAKLEEVAHV